MAVQVKATYKLTGWKGPQFERRVKTIIDQYDKALFPQLSEEIQRVQFSWPRETKRKNNSVVGSPRNIVDLGGLLRSQERRRISATTLLYRWNAPYAALVLTGYTTRRGTVVPGRDWIKPALEAQPLDRFFAAEWRKLAGLGL